MSASPDRREVAPSGDQVELTLGNQRAVVVEVGGGVREYSVDGRDVLDGYSVVERCPSGRGQLLIPWPNRIQDGRYEFDGRGHQLPLTEPDLGNAIHGLVRWAAWRVGEREPGRVVMGHTIHAQPGYPFTLALEVEYALSKNGLSVRTTATNMGADSCPYGCGAHPYLTLGTPTIDTLVLQAPGRQVLVHDERDLPIGSEPVAGTEFDFRQARRIDATVLDNAFTDLERDADGRARVILSDPDTGRSLALSVDEHYPYLMLFTGDPLPDVNRRALAVEPMTCPPNAFRTGDSVIRLAPGESATGVWEITPVRSSPPPCSATA
ncbi:MAG TPA: aldose 1-epimerase family protein [Gaiellaceae bacterium]